MSLTLSVVSAGHVPPLLLEANGKTTLLPVVGDPPLGVVRTADYREHRFPLTLDSTLLVVTDGAIEVPGEPLDAGLERLAELARREPDVRRLCSAVVDGEALNRPLADDVAVLAVRLVPLPDRLLQTWPADSSTLRAVRHVVRRWLAKWSVDDDAAYDITVAVQEACSNAVDHAYPPGTGEFEVDAAYDDGAILISVRDSGSWRDPRGGHRGRGLPIMRALMDSVEVERSGGTTVVLRRVLNPRAPQ